MMENKTKIDLKNKSIFMGHIHIGCRVWFSVLIAAPG